MFRQNSAMVLARRRGIFLALILPLLLLTGAAHAEVTETWIQEGEPSWATVTAWKTYPAKRTLRLQLAGTPSRELAEKLRGAGFAHIEIASEDYPIASATEAWKSLAALPADYIYMGGRFPTEAQVKLLNEIRFPRLLLVVNRYLEYQENSALSGLSPDQVYDLHFHANKYPQYLHKFPIAALPAQVGVQISADYWPRYIQMDNLNLIPQMKTIRVRGTALTAASVPYLLNLKHLKELVFESGFEPAFAQWPTLEKLPLRWLLTDILPKPATLDALQTWVRTSGAKFRMTLDPGGRRPTADERARYDSLPFDVEWTADAP